MELGIAIFVTGCQFLVGTASTISFEKTYSNQQITSLKSKAHLFDKYLLYLVISLSPMIEKDASSNVEITIISKPIDFPFNWYSTYPL